MMISAIISIGLTIQLIFQISTADPYHRYELSGGTPSWSEANAMCAATVVDTSTPGSLASIFFDNDDDDYEALKDVKDNGRPKGQQIADDVPFWVGLHRNRFGKFVWIDGSPCDPEAGDLCVTEWLEEPESNDGKDCVTLTVDGTDGTRGYKTELCADTFRYLCSHINGTTVGECEGGGSYTIDDGYCAVWGDPHFLTWSGARHDYMGNRQIVGPEFFYYVAPCHGATVQDLPFTIIGNHYPFGEIVTSLDYITLELFKASYSETDKYDKYYLWISSDIQAYMDATDNNPSYDDHIDEATTLDADGTGEYQAIGQRFQVKYTRLNERKVRVEIKIDGATHPQIRFIIIGWRPRDGRNRLHALFLDPPEDYRCFICGLCGDFKQQLVGTIYDEQQLTTCKGGLESYRKGWSRSNAFAYDIHGNTYEYGYFNEECPLYDRETTTRRLTAEEDQVYIPTVGDDFVYVDPYEACSTIDQQVIAACIAARKAASDDCDIVGTDFCDDLQTDCTLDVCVFCENDASLIDENVEIAFDIPLQDKVAEVQSSAHSLALNQDSFIGANHQIDNNYKRPQDDYEYNYNDYKHHEYPNNNDVVAIKSTWIFYGGLFLSILLIINFLFMCYLNTSQRRKRGYVTVKYSESEYDDSEVAAIQPQI